MGTSLSCDILHEQVALVGTWLGGSVGTSLSCDILHEEVALVGTWLGELGELGGLVGTWLVGTSLLVGTVGLLQESHRQRRRQGRKLLLQPFFL